MEVCLAPRNQEDGSVHAVSIDPGLHAPFTSYSHTKGIARLAKKLLDVYFAFAKFFTRELDTTVIPPSEVSDMAEELESMWQTSKESEGLKCATAGIVIDRDENGAWGTFLQGLLDGALVYSDHARNNMFRVVMFNIAYY
ncbi:hypothetical protein G9A89_021735 [Geosiphon pyriformis]|nr:hypothetical protein G9A89_021735 [Geosiphon pyriformis]